MPPEIHRQPTPNFPVSPTRDCIFVDTSGSSQDWTRVGRPCGDCPLYEASGECDVLEAGGQAVEWMHRAADAEHRRMQERRRHAEALMDRKIPGFRTGGGVDAWIEAYTDASRGLVYEKWAVLMGDMRGLKEINDNPHLGYDAGDNLLFAAAERMRQARLAPRSEWWADEEKRNDPRVIDIGFREHGSDELGILVRSVTKPQALKVLARMTTRFSVERAMEDDRQRILPIMASFVIVHSDDIRSRAINRQLTRTIPTEQQRQDLAKYLFGEAEKEARRRLNTIKGPQYDEMWSEVTKAINAKGQPVPIRPNDDRKISQTFREVCTPYYSSHQRAMLREAGPHMTDRTNRFLQGLADFFR
jgi:GGDEF domain-containing protein